MTTTGPVTNDFTMMLVIHDAFRRDLRRTAAVLAAATEEPITPRRVAAVLERWEWTTEQLHHHHRGEDEWLWPALRRETAADPEVARVLDAMEREHRELEPLQADADRTLRRVAAAGPDAAGADAAGADATGVGASTSPTGIEAAAAAWQTFSTAVTAHLDHEERAAVPLLEHRLPPPALRRFETRQRRSQGLRSTVTQFFPWLLDEAPPHRRVLVLGLLPAPLRWLVGRSIPAYDERVAAAWG